MNGSGVVWGHAEVVGTRSPVLLQLNSFEHFALRDDGTLPHTACAPHVLTLLVSQRATQ